MTFIHGQMLVIGTSHIKYTTLAMTDRVRVNQAFYKKLICTICYVFLSVL